MSHFQLRDRAWVLLTLTLLHLLRCLTFSLGTLGRQAAGYQLLGVFPPGIVIRYTCSYS